MGKGFKGILCLAVLGFAFESAQAQLNPSEVTQLGIGVNPSPATSHLAASLQGSAPTAINIPCSDGGGGFSFLEPCDLVTSRINQQLRKKIFDYLDILYTKGILLDSSQTTNINNPKGTKVARPICSILPNSYLAFKGRTTGEVDSNHLGKTCGEVIHITPKVSGNAKINMRPPRGVWEFSHVRGIYPHVIALALDQVSAEIRATKKISVSPGNEVLAGEYKDALVRNQRFFGDATVCPKTIRVDDTEVAVNCDTLAERLTDDKGSASRRQSEHHCCAARASHWQAAVHFAYSEVFARAGNLLYTKLSSGMNSIQSEITNQIAATCKAEVDSCLNAENAAETVVEGAAAVGAAIGGAIVGAVSGNGVPSPQEVAEDAMNAAISNGCIEQKLNTCYERELKKFFPRKLEDLFRTSAQDRDLTFFWLIGMLGFPRRRKKNSFRKSKDAFLIAVTLGFSSVTALIVSGCCGTEYTCTGSSGCGCGGEGCGAYVADANCTCQMPGAAALEEQRNNCKDFHEQATAEMESPIPSFDECCEVTTISNAIEQQIQLNGKNDDERRKIREEMDKNLGGDGVGTLIEYNKLIERSNCNTYAIKPDSPCNPTKPDETEFGFGISVSGQFVSSARQSGDQLTKIVGGDQGSGVEIDEPVNNLAQTSSAVEGELGTTDGKRKTGADKSAQGTAGNKANSKGSSKGASGSGGSAGGGSAAMGLNAGKTDEKFPDADASGGPITTATNDAVTTGAGGSSAATAGGGFGRGGDTLSAPAGGAEAQFGANGDGAGGNVSPLGSNDPEDYFTRTNLDENLFKKVEKKLIEKQGNWAMQDKAKFVPTEKEPNTP